MDPIAEQGWLWAHRILDPLHDSDKRAWDVAVCAVLVAYRAGVRAGNPTPLDEVEYSDSDITGQIARLNEGFAARGWKVPSMPLTYPGGN